MLRHLAEITEEDVFEKPSKTAPYRVINTDLQIAKRLAARLGLKEDKGSELILHGLTYHLAFLRATSQDFSVEAKAWVTLLIKNRSLFVQFVKYYNKNV